MIRKTRRRAGFTLAELLIVVAIVGILLAILIPTFSSSLKRSQETVCAANRTTLARQLIYELILNGDGGLDEQISQIQADHTACPSHGTYSVKADGFLITITCTVHGALVVGDGGADATVSEKLLQDFQSFIRDPENAKADNNTLRKNFLEAYGGSWPTLTVDGHTYYIQPYVNNLSNKDDPIESRSWLFARADNSADQGWNVNYVFNPLDGKWYGATNYKGEQVTEQTRTFGLKLTLEGLNELLTQGRDSRGYREWLPIDAYEESVPVTG